MNGFYVSLIFLGILLVVFSLACIFLDKRKSFGIIRSFDAKKQELSEIISEAEEMIEELNKFSDYIVNLMDLKNEEMSKNLQIAEEKVCILSKKLGAAAVAVNGTMIDRTDAVAASGAMTDRTVFAIDYAIMDSDSCTATKTAAAAKRPYAVAAQKKNDKVISINKKHSEVLRLSNEGMQSLDIAKKLNMGKGEVELILGIRK